MSVFKGAAVAICTPFLANGEVDYDKFREQIEYQIENGTDAIVICGTTGEASCLSHEEHLECIKFCAEVVDHRIPVIAGTGSNCTETAVYLSQEAEKYGVDAILVVTPYYNKSTQKGLIEHFTIVANSVKIPMILYNVPGRTGCNILPETAATLVRDVPNIVGIKEASGNISQIAKLMSICGDQIELYSGNDDQIVPILSLGGLGVISVLSNVAPRKTHDICQAFFDNDPALAAKRQLDAIPLCNALFCEVNPIPVKKALELQGRDRGVLRRPLCEMDPDNAAKLKVAMEEYGVL
ncbi:MAG: 4-hydroxy-tetrahydrodipicolinate synthase [Lachnospiraceae bacterium]|jgi:4-hydroxy-tetrahydrodipicolinate synthase|nr:4-hydroxy-tetrahydrodipicolinate synthase [Lachnospiraceae bacterium]MBQ6319149.1 4-hydroxy-tetrahydrodipicolinate synthase [Lachnospiraceae bacterium]MBQ8665836.1 4-hydroxy-tetrahydrodipicolinate synthase [Lachnospiraceae bacterium]